MQHVLQYSKDWPNWQAGAARRLNVSMFVATLLVIGILSVVRFPTIDLLFPLMEIVVDIVNVNEPVEEAAPLPETVVEPLPQTVEPIAEPVPAEPVPAEQAVEEAPTPVAEPAAEAQPIPNAVVTLSIDWEFEKVQAVKDAIDALERVASVNPNFDQLRKEAAVKFRASRAPVKNEPWDYVDKDQAGRTILSCRCGIFSPSNSPCGPASPVSSGPKPRRLPLPRWNLSAQIRTSLTTGARK